MASTRYFSFTLVLLALAVSLSCSSAAGEVKVPVIHIISAVPEPIKLTLTDGNPKQVNLNPGQEHQVQVLDQKTNYNMMAYYVQNKFAGVDLYDPARDEGHAAIYWKADAWGFWSSYDNVKYEKKVQWDTE